MENKSRFTKAYDSLVKAYYDGTLAKGTCVACAVANIVSDAMGGIIVRKSARYFECTVNNTDWSEVFCTTNGKQKYAKNRYPDIEKELKKLTGYTAMQLAKVEYAFETNTRLNNSQYYDCTEQEILEDQFNGLEAVVNVLLEIEGMTNNGHIEKFREHPKLVAIEAN